ncbi:hypothetical protein DSO57_1039771 [Entomophthora muscae]|uniref:Uncharacterized protein n=1 Tax=Entomophthora muscae TaxID=34485 RepID=A0ACC2RPM8_9FUNG|nr:hypothetical protein DSO57_1039771 [Entomophthora muscae]
MEILNSGLAVRGTVGFEVLLQSLVSGFLQCIQKFTQGFKVHHLQQAQLVDGIRFMFGKAEFSLGLPIGPGGNLNILMPDTGFPQEKTADLMEAVLVGELELLSIILESIQPSSIPILLEARKLLSNQELRQGVTKKRGRGRDSKGGGSRSPSRRFNSRNGGRGSRHCNKQQDTGNNTKTAIQVW